ANAGRDPAGVGPQLEIGPAEGLRERVVALPGHVDADVVRAVQRLGVQLDREGVAYVRGDPVARGVQGPVPPVRGAAGTAELAVRSGGLVVAAGAVDVQAVPVPHRIGIGLPGLPTHRVLSGHDRILEVVTPTLPAPVVA